jgi:hypothetical protein
MTLSDLASLGSFVSGLAVVVTLIFLVLQMRQTNKNQKALMQQGRSDRLIQVSTLLADRYQSELWARATQGETGFTPGEISSLMRMNATWFWTYEDSFLQHRAGLLDDAGWATDLNSLRGMVADPGSRTAWRLLRGYAGGPYAEFVDRLMADSEANPVPDLSAAWKNIMTEEWSRRRRS